MVVSPLDNLSEFFGCPKENLVVHKEICSNLLEQQFVNLLHELWVAMSNGQPTSFGYQSQILVVWGDQTTVKGEP